MYMNFKQVNPSNLLLWNELVTSVVFTDLNWNTNIYTTDCTYNTVNTMLCI